MLSQWEMYFCFQGTAVTRISAGSLPRNLSELDLIDTPLTDIDDTVLEGSATTLKILTIYRAHLTKIPKAVAALRNLQQFRVTAVPIQDWNEDAMKNIGPSVEILSVDSVDLSTSPTWLQYFSRLTQLSILNCNLNSLPENALSFVTNTLTIISFYNNSLTSIPKTFSSLKSLQELIIGSNRISNTEWLPRSSNVTSLSLDGNRISNATQLSNALRPYGASLMSLQIYNNELTAIPELSFLTRIGDLDFTHNRISDPNYGSLPPGLFSLDLRYNYLPLIPRLMSALSSITDIVLPSNSILHINGQDLPPNAASVELGYNLITEISDTSFPQISGISSLYLNNNPITAVSPAAFKNLPKLSELSLQDTHLKRLPLALSSLAGLYNFDITGTSALVCTCLEKGLEKWVLAIGRDHVSGTCGETTIYEFFSTLSPDCPEQ